MRSVWPAALVCLLGLLVCPPAAAAQAETAFSRCSPTHKAVAAPEEVRPGVRRTIYEGLQLVCEDLRLYADRVEMLSDSDWVELSGHVTFVRANITLIAASARYNHKERIGTFVEVVGFATIHEQEVQKTAFGGGEPQFAFTARRVEKVGPDTFKVEGATVTSCMQPTPRWNFRGSSGTFTVGDHVSMTNAVLWVKGVPLLYVPYFRYPISGEERSTGFLMPSLGSDTFQGFAVSNAFFWAIARSVDATFFHDYYGQDTQGFGGEFRYVAAPGSTGTMLVYLRNERARLSTDGISVQPALRTFDVRGTVTQALPGHFQLNATVNYFSNARTQQLFQQDFYTASNSNRTIIADLSGRLGRYWHLNSRFEQTDVFRDLDSASRSGSAPRIALNLSQTPLFNSNYLYLGARVATTRVVQQSDTSLPETSRTLWRGEASSNLSATVSRLSFLPITVSTHWRGQHWTNSQDATTGTLLGRAVGRQYTQLQAEIGGPKLERLFRTPDNGYATAWLHRIEPQFTYSWTSPFSGFSNLVQSGAAEAFVSSEATYQLSNIVLAGRRVASGPTIPREIVRVTLQQTYYADQNAASYDYNYQTIPGLAPPSRFSPLRFDATARPTDEVSATLRADFEPRTRRLRTLDASGWIRLQSPRVNLRASYTRINDPLFPRNSLTATVSGDRKSGRFGGAYDMTIDLEDGRWRNQRVRAFYNAQCCGITFDYGVSDVAHLNAQVPKRQTFGITFSLAGIGSFVTPLGGFGR